MAYAKRVFKGRSATMIAKESKTMKWFTMEEIPNCTPLMTAHPLKGFVDMRRYGIDTNVGKGVVECREGTESLIFPRESFTATGKAILTKLLGNPRWGIELSDMLVRLNREYYEYSEHVRHLDLEGMSNAELARTFAELSQRQGESHSAGMPWNALEFEHQMFTNYLLGYVKERLAKGGKGQRAGEVFSTLTTPLEESFAQREERSLLRIAAKIQGDVRAWELFNQNASNHIEHELPDVNPRIHRMLQEHRRDFCWISYMYEGPAWEMGYFIDTLKGLVANNADIKRSLENIARRANELEHRQEQLIRELGIDHKHAELFEVAKGIVFTKGFRKDCLYHGCYCMEPLLREIAKRLGLKLKQVRRMMPWEIPLALQGGPFSKEELDERFHHYVLYTHDGKQEVLLGDKARAFMGKLDMEKEANEEVHELVGSCACPGSARGVVKVVNRVEDMDRMESGDILVSKMTTPDLVPAMKKAGAIVTDMGGITCHAAIVSRELGVPCVIGTKVATKALKDGDLVHVDATHGKVTKLGAREPTVLG